MHQGKCCGFLERLDSKRHESRSVLSGGDDASVVRWNGYVSRLPKCFLSLKVIGPMSYALAALEHAAFQMSEYKLSPLANAKNETPDQQTACTQQKSASPRTSLASRFFSGVSTLAQRVCVWIKDKAAVAISPIVNMICARKHNENLLQISLALHTDDLEWKTYCSESESS